MIYVDSNALVKMVTVEDETDALMSYLEQNDDGVLVSSELARLEVGRVLIRKRVPGFVRADAEQLLSGVVQRNISVVLDDAQNFPQRYLRSLDAIHLATAVQLGDTLSQFISYDECLADAARELNLPVLSPGAEI